MCCVLSVVHSARNAPPSLPMPPQAVLVDCDAGQRRSLMDLLQHYRCAHVVVSAAWVKLQMGASLKVSAIRLSMEARGKPAPL